jgi:beta-glucosidase
MPSNTSPVERRIDELLSRMTLDEKLALLCGANWMETPAIPGLGIPAIKMNDGPLGVRFWSKDVTTSPKSFGTTAFPAGIAMAATWDPPLVEQEGKAIAEQVKALGRNMLLGPTVNIARLPQWGRNFEGYGEDPYLASRMAVAYVRGVKHEGVIATVKHFAANNQEVERNRVDVEVTERALHEIYFPAFKAAIVDGQAGAVMSAYNKVNGHWCAENRVLLGEVLRSQWGFQGLVVSDWGSTHSTAKSLDAGLDVEMPGGDGLASFRKEPDFAEFHFDGGYLAADRVKQALESGEVGGADIDGKVRHILWALETHGLLHREEQPPTMVVDTPDQRAVARQAAIESLVLLKNDKALLPLQADALSSLAVIGPNAGTARTGGGGSALVVPRTKPASPTEAILARLGSKAKVAHAEGCPMEGEPAWLDSAPEHRVHLRDAAARLAAESEAAVVVVGFSPANEREGYDRTFELPAGQDDLIRSVAEANPNTVVVLQAGGPVAMPWIDKVRAVVMAWYPGQAVGQAISAVLFGDENPSGKLPVTFPKTWSDSPAHDHYPGTDLRVRYAEGIYVGYRHFDSKGIDPLFPFGHGLSYTTFTYSDLIIDNPRLRERQILSLSMKVRNSGRHPGAEVAQLYLRDLEASVDRPPRELKGFQRVVLAPGETADLTFRLDPDALAFWDEKTKAWVAEPGMFEIQVGASSRDLRLVGAFNYDP